jgi:hypothetical protein
MQCDTKTMLKVGAGIGVALAIAYFAMSAFRIWIVGSTPILLSLICPLSMLFMMKGMSSCSKESETKASKPEILPSTSKEVTE